MCIWCELRGNQPRWDASLQQAAGTDVHLMWTPGKSASLRCLPVLGRNRWRVQSNSATICAAQHEDLSSSSSSRFCQISKISHAWSYVYIYIYIFICIYLYIQSHTYITYIIYMYNYVICILIVRCQNGCPELGRWGALGGRLCGRGLWLSQQRQRIRHLEPLWKPPPWRQGHVPILMLWMILNVYRPIHYLGETWWHHDIQFYQKKIYCIYIYTYGIYCIYI